MLAVARRATRWSGEPLIWVVVAAAWSLTAALFLAGWADLISHDALLAAGSLPGIRDLILFLATWQVMTGAMMLPSSVPMVGLFARVSRRQENPRQVLGAFLVGYFLVWTGFAVAALAADAALHELIERWAWLDEQPEIITGSALLLAGAFQFSALKERCLDACRNPMSFLWRFYGRGTRQAWSLGLRHGLFCLGCCWALMLVMFAVGVGSPVWMAALTGVMAIEKTAKWGRMVAPLVGVGLIACGAIILGIGEAAAHAGEDHTGNERFSVANGVIVLAAVAVTGLVIWMRNRAHGASGGTDRPVPGRSDSRIERRV